MPGLTPSTATPTIRGLPRGLARQLEAYADRLDVDQIRTAYDLAAEAHSGQRRASGEPYVNHAVEVATILASLRLDTATIAAGLVHDAVEDTAVSLADLRGKFGDEIANLVDGVTKIGKVEFRSNTEQQMENYRKLLLSMAEDARVILIKLADRLHNMRTLEHLPVMKQQRIALETREIYAPLAHRLGIAQVRWELEDLAFKFLEPAEYDELSTKLQQRRRERERQVFEMQRPLEDALTSAGIPAEITGRPKHLWSIYKKMEKSSRAYEEIYDLMAMRITTDSVQNCYAALGVIHSKWTPIQERFHDYIATPKSNMSRSIHTTVCGPGGRRDLDPGSRRGAARGPFPLSTRGCGARRAAAAGAGQAGELGRHETFGPRPRCPAQRAEVVPLQARAPTSADTACDKPSTLRWYIGNTFRMIRTVR